MLEEVVRIVSPALPGQIIDATLGLGGHTEALLDRFPEARVIGLDQDREAIEFAKKRLEPFGNRVEILRSNFADLRNLVRRAGLASVNVIIADLGVSSLQFDSANRGFSFRFDAPLDMRMDPDSDAQTAADLLRTLSEEQIANVIYQFGEERASRKIARSIVKRREQGNPVKSTFDLAKLVEGVVRKGPKDKIHPATRTFQALRIAVNNELGVLEEFLRDATDVLAREGILAIITFHSLEDRAVKRAFQKLSGKCFCPPRQPVCTCGAVRKAEILTKKPIVPTDDEMAMNPRSRSAKLRALKRL
jgi:16S rRNA (cytosine1402-N4)-methyltransferase